MLNNFMMDPFGHPQQMRSNGNNSGSGSGHRSSNNNMMMMSPFGGSAMSPFDRHNQLMQQMNSNPFALMNQMMNFNNMSSMGGGGGGMQQFVRYYYRKTYYHYILNFDLRSNKLIRHSSVYKMLN